MNDNTIKALLLLIFLGKMESKIKDEEDPLTYFGIGNFSLFCFILSFLGFLVSIVIFTDKNVYEEKLYLLIIMFIALDIAFFIETLALIIKIIRKIKFKKNKE